MALNSQQLLQKLKQIQLAVFDVDGVMTDGRLYYSADGHEAKAFHSQDGLGLKEIMKIGIHVAVITGRSSAIVTRRMDELGIELVYQGCSDKPPAFLEILKKLNISAENSLYMGDDVIDLGVMKQCGVAIGVPNAHSSVLEYAHWITPRAGGLGAVRDVCDAMVHAQQS